jgi:hypothetical protein
MAGIFARATALTAMGMTVVSGCSWLRDSYRAVSAADLQQTLVGQLAGAGTPSTWVECSKDLPGRVGAVARCDVKFSSDNTVTAVLTTTQVSGDEITWEVTGPELTKDQVTRRIAGLTSAQSATCDSGLDGHSGDWAQCQIVRDGVTLNQIVEVKDAVGLSLELALTPAIPKHQIEDLLRNRLAAKYSLPFESATCPEDLVGLTGTTMDCVATSDGLRQSFTLVVTDTQNGNMNFEVAAKGAPGEVIPERMPAEIVPQPAPVEQFVPQPAPVQQFVPQPAPSKVVPQPAPVEVVPHLPPVVPHLPPGDAVPAPGPVATQAGGGQVVTQAAGG